MEMIYKIRTLSLLMSLLVGLSASAKSASHQDKQAAIVGVYSGIGLIEGSGGLGDNYTAVFHEDGTVVFYVAFSKNPNAPTTDLTGLWKHVCDNTYKFVVTRVRTAVDCGVEEGCGILSQVGRDKITGEVTLHKNCQKFEGPAVLTLGYPIDDYKLKAQGLPTINLALYAERLTLK